MNRPVRGRGWGGRGRGQGRVPRRRANTRANAAHSSVGSGSQSENQSHHSEQQQRQEPVDPYVMMQGMMAQMTQMGQLMETMQRIATAGQQQQQGQQPLPNGGVASHIINDISRQRPPIFEGSSEPADIIHWIDYFEKLFKMVNCLEKNRTAVAAYYLGKSAHTWWLATIPWLRHSRPFLTLLTFSAAIGDFKPFFTIWIIFNHGCIILLGSLVDINIV
ncbi:hypothetical protein OROGR_026649 [Orobanche gracilis]